MYTHTYAYICILRLVRVYAYMYSCKKSLCVLVHDGPDNIECVTIM